jgi:TRAP transporter TAXI family solute receptor
MSFNLLFRNRWWLLYAPILVLAMLLTWLSFTRWAPLPPRHLVLAAGNPDGGYSEMARRYAQRLEQSGVSTHVVFNEGAVGATNRFAAESSQAEAGFVQGLYAGRLQPDVQALAVVAREPVWVITRDSGVTSVEQLRGKRIAVGTPESSSHVSAELILRAHGLTPSDITPLNVAGLAAINALVDGQADAVIQVLGLHTPAAQLALQSPALQFIGLAHSEAVRARQPRLHAMVLPQGAVDLRSDVPPSDLPMLSTETHLVVRSSMHPALQRLLLKTAIETHEIPNLLQRDRDYPSWSPVDIPLSPHTSPNATTQPGFETMFAYRWAQWVRTMVLFVLPVWLIAVLLLYWIPRWLDWHVDAALLHYYGELRFIDDELVGVAAEQPIALNAILQRLDAIERTVSDLKFPEAYSERWYTLRAHLADSRQRLLQLRAR